MRMFPGPASGALLAFDEVAVPVFRDVDEGDIAVVDFRFGVHHVEDALGTGQGHHDGVRLHGDLRDGLAEVPVQRQVRDEGTDGQ